MTSPLHALAMTAGLLCAATAFAQTSAPAATAPAMPASPGATAPAPMTGSAMPADGMGMAGKVWVTKGSKSYHCEGSKSYGKAKGGEYMTESDARAKGYKADHGKACAR